MRGEAYLDEALSDFSGYIAADEIYDGPFCILFIVDNRRFRRLAYEVLDRNATKADVEAFFGRFRAAVDARGLAVRGVTTDGSDLYPDAIAKVFPGPSRSGPGGAGRKRPGARHQSCEFHVLKEIMTAVLRALATVRKSLKREIPSLPRGRPTKETKKLARKAKRLRRHIRELFDNRHLFVKRELTPSERKTVARLARRHGELRPLRGIVDEVYRLFDRRCRTETALRKLARLRLRVQRFQGLRRILRKLWSPNLEKALTFLDDSLLPPTSNAVERTNRRHRKMQKTIYRVRTKAHVSGRISLDCLREARGCARERVTQVLHLQRAA